MERRSRSTPTRSLPAVPTTGGSRRTWNSASEPARRQRGLLEVLRPLGALQLQDVGADVVVRHADLRVRSAAGFQRAAQGVGPAGEVGLDPSVIIEPCGSDR